MADYNENLHNNSNPSIYDNARHLRKVTTVAEEILWQALRNRKVMNLKFRRQHPFGTYILDFYCNEIKLCIEADGSIHGRKDIAEYDIERTKVLNENGVTVLRFTNKEIIETVTTVANKIAAFVKNRKGG